MTQDEFRREVQEAQRLRTLRVLRGLCVCGSPEHNRRWPPQRLCALFKATLCPNAKVCSAGPWIGTDLKCPHLVCECGKRVWAPEECTIHIAGATRE